MFGHRGTEKIALGFYTRALVCTGEFFAGTIFQAGHPLGTPAFIYRKGSKLRFWLQNRTRSLRPPGYLATQAGENHLFTWLP